MKRVLDATDLPAKPPISADRTSKRKRRDLHDKILPEWLAHPSQNSTPWCTKAVAKDYGQRLRSEMGRWLHNEILDFYDYVKPDPHEKAIREHLMSRIERALLYGDGTNVPGRIH